MPSPRRTSRLFRCTKWTCTILAGVMVVAWVGSRIVWVGWKGNSSRLSCEVLVRGEAIRGNFAPHGNLDLNGITYWLSGFRWGTHQRATYTSSWQWSPSFFKRGDGRFIFFLPLWLPTLVFAVPAAWMWRVDVKRRRAAREGCCAKCGYSLVGTPAERPCPECGTSVTPTTGHHDPRR